MVDKPNIWLVGAGTDLQPLAELLCSTGAETYVSDPYAAERGASKASVLQMAENAGAALGRIDTLVFCDRIRPCETSPVDGEDLVRQTLAAVTGLLHTVSNMARAVAEGQRSKQVIVVCDLWAVSGRNGSVIGATVGGALIGMCKSLAKELGRYRIAVNVICLGPFAGSDSANALAPAEAMMFKVTGIGKPPTLAHLANNIRHLANGEHWMTGQVLHVNDGFVM